MNQEFLNKLGEFIKALKMRNEALIKDLVIAKVTDPDVARQLSDEITMIGNILSELADADTEDKLKKCLEEAKKKLTNDEQQ